MVLSNPSDDNSVDRAVAFIVIQTCLAMNKSSKRLVSDCSDGFGDSMILRNQNAKKVWCSFRVGNPTSSVAGRS